MFRLMKLAAYALLGYAIYEFIRGMSQGQASGATATESREPRPIEDFAGDSGQRVTGGGEGMVAQASTADGGVARHVVGRGVVRR